MTPYVVVNFYFGPESISDSFLDSTAIIEYFIATKVNKSCVVSIIQRKIVVDYIDLHIVDFDVVFSIDWLLSCYASFYFRTRKVIFHFLMT